MKLHNLHNQFWNYGSIGDGDIYIEGTTNYVGIEIKGNSATDLSLAPSIISDHNGIYIANMSMQYTEYTDIQAGGELYIKQSNLKNSSGLVVTAPANLIGLDDVNIEDIKTAVL